MLFFSILSLVALRLWLIKSCHVVICCFLTTWVFPDPDWQPSLESRSHPFIRSLGGKYGQSNMFTITWFYKQYAPYDVSPALHIQVKMCQFLHYFAVCSKDFGFLGSLHCLTTVICPIMGLYYCTLNWINVNACYEIIIECVQYFRPEEQSYGSIGLMKKINYCVMMQ